MAEQNRAKHSNTRTYRSSPTGSLGQLLRRPSAFSQRVAPTVQSDRPAVGGLRATTSSRSFLRIHRPRGNYRRATHSVDAFGPSATTVTTSTLRSLDALPRSLPELQSRSARADPLVDVPRTRRPSQEHILRQTFLATCGRLGSSPLVARPARYEPSGYRARPPAAYRSPRNQGFVVLAENKRLGS